MASRQITQPINQVRLTNVAVVRYTSKGSSAASSRFEIACYRNKVMDYRAGLETDLSEVLQTDRIFTNVSKGRFAKSADLKKAFGTSNQQEIALQILQKGELQVSDLERNQQLESTIAQIATWVSHNCVVTNTGRPFSIHQIKTALQQYPIQLQKPIKKQYLDAVKYLKTVLPLERAKMELSITYPTENKAALQETLTQRQVEYRKITSSTAAVETTTAATANKSVLVIQVDPSLYRTIQEIVTLPGIDGRLEIKRHVVMDVGGGEVEGEEQAGMQQGVALDSNQHHHHEPDFVYDSSDEEVVALAEKLHQVRTVAGTAGDANEDDDRSTSTEGEHDKKQVAGTGAPPTISQRTQRRKTNKKKKALQKKGKLEQNDSSSSDDALIDKHRQAVPVFTLPSGADDDDEDVLVPLESQPAANRKNQRNKKALKKKNKKTLRQSHQEDDSDDDDSNNASKEEVKNNKNDENMAASSSNNESNDSMKPAQSSTTTRSETHSNGGVDAAAATDVKHCNTCGGAFANAQQYRAHFRSDWHKFNQKLLVKGLQPVSEQEFLLCDADAFFGNGKV